MHRQLADASMALALSMPLGIDPPPLGCILVSIVLVHVGAQK